MEHTIWTSDLLKLNKDVTRAFIQFCQEMANRRGQGAARYGDIPTTKQKFLSRLKKELKVYEAEGNKEQLLNIAVYCFLESYAPQNKKYHFDPTRKSATRKGD